MFIFLVCGVKVLCSSFVLHFTYFILSLRLLLIIVLLIFSSSLETHLFFLLVIFLFVVKCSMKFDLVFAFTGRLYISQVDQAVDPAFSPLSGSPILQEIPRGAVVPQGIFWWYPWWAITHSQLPCNFENLVYSTVISFLSICDQYGCVSSQHERSKCTFGCFGVGTSCS